jgi:hypothetical protein
VLILRIISPCTDRLSTRAKKVVDSVEGVKGWKNFNFQLVMDALEARETAKKIYRRIQVRAVSGVPSQNFMLTATTISYVQRDSDWVLRRELEPGFEPQAFPGKPRKPEKCWKGWKGELISALCPLTPWMLTVSQCSILRTRWRTLSPAS